MEDGKREMLGQQHDAVEAEEAAMMMPSTSTSKSTNVDQQTTNANQSEMGGEQPQEELLVVEDNEQLNEALESYAKAHNLTAQKVKNIIFHIVKNPQTFATLIRKDPDAMAGLRMTRSRLRQLERIARRRILPPELKPINVPKTFLDVNYGEEGDGEDTEDADYTPAGGDGVKIKTEREATDNDDDESKEGDDVLSSSASADEASSSNEEEEEEEDEPTMEGEHLEQQNKGHESGRKSRMENGEEMLGMEAGAMNDGLDSARGDFLTEVDNPIYSHFVKSVMGGVGDAELDDPFTRALYNEEDDSEYVFHEFDEFCAGDDGEEGEEEEEDEDEFRRDRATEIPRWELRALEQDFVDSALPNVPVDEPGAHGSTPTKGMMKQRPWSRQQQQHSNSNYNRHENVQRIGGEESSSIGRTASSVQSGSSGFREVSSTATTTTADSTTTKTTKVVITETRAARTTTTVPPPENVSDSSSESCSLLVPPEQLRFTDTELRALKVQMEKHVQLLCQCIVGTSQYPELLDPRNRAVTMLCDLDELAQQRLDQPSSLFHVDNLHAAVFSAHDIQACHEVDLPLKKWEGQPSKETMWVLARSEACRYPELMPCRQFKLFDQMHSHFLRSEQLLLALALHQLRHVPFAGSKPAPFAPKSAPPIRRGRYPLIVDHFLANKSVQQIRNYLKNVRACPSPTLLQRIVCQAERGIFHVNYRPDLGENGQRQIPLNWPEEQQPLWLKWLASLFRQGNVEIMAVTTVSMSTNVPAAIEANTTTETAAPTAIELDSERKLKRRQLNNSPNANDELEEATSRKKWAKVDEGVEVEMVHDDEQQPPQSAGEEEEEEEGQQMENSNNKRRRRDSSADGNGTAAGCFGCCTTSGPDETSNEQFPTIVPFVAAATSTESASAASNTQQKQQQCDANMGNGNGTAQEQEQDSMVEEQQQQGKEEAAEEAGGGTTSAATTTTTIGAESQQQQSQRKSRRRLRAEKGLAALCSQPARDNVMRALVEAIYGDFKQRMFMHQDKLRTVQSILHRPGLSTAERFSHLWHQLGHTHPQSFFLFAAVAPDHELPPTLRAHPDRMASKQALNMVHTIQSYMAGSRSAMHTRNTFRFLREARDALTSEDRLFEALQRHFGVRDEPLWKLLRRQWLGARFAEKIEDWQFETVDLDKVQQQTDPTTTGIGMEENGLLRFETVKLPYRHDPTERSRLRVRHGRVTVELNGRLRSVAIEYPQPASGTQSNIGSPEEKQPIKAVLPTADHQQQASKSTKIISGTSTAQGQQPVAEIAWTRELDAALLIGFSEAGRDRHKCIANFLASPCCCGRRFSREDVANRLQSLVNVARQLQQQQHQKGK